MRTLLFLNILFLATNSFCQINDNSLLPYKIDNKFVFCDSNLNQRIKTKFDYVEPFNKGYSIVSINKKFGVIDLKGTTIVPLKFQKIKYKYSYGQTTKDNPDGVYFSTNNDSIYYSYLGKQLEVTPVEDEIATIEFEEYIDIFKSNELYGFISDGDTLIKPMYNFLDKPVKYYSLLIARKGEFYGIISTSNENILSFEYNKITWDSNNNMFILEKNKTNNLCYYYFSGRHSKVFCGYKNLIKKFSDKYILVENPENAIYFLDLNTGKELRIK